MQNYRDLKVWQKLMKLTMNNYEIIKKTKPEVCGFRQQIRRSAISMPNNKEEGYGRYFTKEYSN